MGNWRQYLPSRSTTTSGLLRVTTRQAPKVLEDHQSNLATALRADFQYPNPIWVASSRRECREWSSRIDSTRVPEAGATFRRPGNPCHPIWPAPSSHLDWAEASYRRAQCRRPGPASDRTRRLTAIGGGVTLLPRRIPRSPRAL